MLAGANEFGQRFLGLTPLQSRDLFWWLMVPWTLFVVLAVERRRLASIGLKRPDWKTIVFGTGGAVAVFAAALLADPIEAHFHLTWQGHTAGAAALLATPWWYRFTVVLRAALVEELVFRGYAIERLEQLTGSRVVAGLASLAAFAFAHLAYWGWAPLIGVSLAGLVLTVLYQWRRDLGANMIAHFLVDAVSVLG